MSDFKKVATFDLEMDRVNGEPHPAPLGSAPAQALPTKANEKRSLRFSEAGLSEATLVWRNLDKFVEIDEGKSKKQILFKVGGVAKPGDLIALMGPSGSGKTTLLNVLGGRALANLTGEVLINNVKYKKSMRRTIAYVLQEDIFYTNLTVRQQLYFTSNLRLPDSLSAETKRAVVDQVIKTLRIEKCADTQIMMISGGEKKRCNIGTELLTNPSILLLDEPTSGLDSTAANSLVNTLRELATDRMTIITSIHQPSSKVFYSFDKLILMADGYMVYTGPPSKCLQYLARVGYVPPMDYNPADFIMDLVTSTEAGAAQVCSGMGPAPPSGGSPKIAAHKAAIVTVTATDSSSETARTIDCDVEMALIDKSTMKSIRTILIEAWDNTPIEQEIEAICASFAGTAAAAAAGNEDGGDDGVNIKYLASYKTQFIILLERALVNSKAVLVTNLTVFQTVAVALIAGALWWDIPNTETHVNDKASFIFFFMTYWFFSTLFHGLMQFLPERTILLKERAAGSYRLSAYFLSKTISELPVRLTLPFAFLAISYYMAGMNPSAKIFFSIVGTQLLAALAGESVGLFIGTITTDFQKALVLATLGALTLMLTGGFLIQNLPDFVNWLRYLSPFKYSYDACVQLEYSGRNVQCVDGSVLSGCIGNIHGSVSGQEAVDLLGSTQSVGLNEACLIIFILGFRTLAYLALRFMPHNNGRV